MPTLSWIMMTMKFGAEIFIDGLLREKVDTIFGIPGGAVIPIFDVLFDYRDNIRFVLTRHEQGACHMADGFARVSGRVGVCIATSGPGATNLTTALATAYKDSIPIVAFTGQVATSLIGHDAFQEIDTQGVTRPVTKHNFLVKDVANLSLIIQQAFYIARTGRPGPVVVDIPVDVQKSYCNPIWQKAVSLPGCRDIRSGHFGQIKKAAQMINNASKPLLYIGGGVIMSEASEEIIELSKRADIPIVATLMALGAIPPTFPNYLYMTGMHGSYSANMAFQHCDLIIAIGARFDDRVTGNLAGFAPGAKIIHIDLDPVSIAKNMPVTVPIVGDAKLVVTKLLAYVSPSNSTLWLRQTIMWKQTHPFKYKRGRELHPGYFLQQLSGIASDDAIVVTDVGQHQMWTAQFYQIHKPRHFLTSGGLGTMGYGLPAAIGAKIAQPDKQVILITGESSFQMNIQELATLALNKLQIKIFILNNNYLGMVRQWQQIYFNKRYSGVNVAIADGYGNTNGKSRVYPDFVKLAKSYGIKGYRIKRKSMVKTIIDKALSQKKTTIVDILIDREENVLPMISAASGNLDDIILRLI